MKAPRVLMLGGALLAFSPRITSTVKDMVSCSIAVMDIFLMRMRKRRDIGRTEEIERHVNNFL